MTISFTRPGAFHFVEMPVVAQLPVFSKPVYVQLLLDGLRYCQEFKGLEIYAWCILPERVLLVVRTDQVLSDIIRDLKKYCSKRILQSMLEQQDPMEMKWLATFREAGNRITANKYYQFWEHRYSPLVLFSPRFTQNKINMIHEQPVSSGLANTPENYPYSSALDYAGGTGLLKLDGIMA